MAWAIGADDRWHVPGDDPTLRQRLPGPGVVETVIRVPGGDAIQRVYGVGGPGDVAVLEFENASPLPFGVALGIDGDLPALFLRAPTPVDDSPLTTDRAVMVPVAHRTVVRVAVPLVGGSIEVDVSRLPSSGDAQRAWSRLLEEGARVEVPDERLGRAVAAARASLLLFDDGVEVQGAPFSESSPDDAVAILTALERWGLQGHAAEVGAGISRRQRKRLGPARLDPPTALARVGEMLSSASPTFAWPSGAEGHHGARTAAFLLAVRDALVADEPGRVAVLPTLAPGWESAPLEVHQMPVGAASDLSFALRWHGSRPALIWELVGNGAGGLVTLTAPGLDPTWSTDEPRGEALLGA
ncbi:MAG: hypothetical protein HYU28_06565 [Actinobacteria bacterium]|nr:hypothetical protein [Actinomycetota bacterium]